MREKPTSFLTVIIIVVICFIISLLLSLYENLNTPIDDKPVDFFTITHILICILFYWLVDHYSDSRIKSIFITFFLVVIYEGLEILIPSIISYYGIEWLYWVIVNFTNEITLNAIIDILADTFGILIGFLVKKLFIPEGSL